MPHKLNETRITVNNLTVSYVDEGPVNATVIIFIHGFPLNKSITLYTKAKAFSEIITF